MTAYLSTSCFGRVSVAAAITKCQKIAGNYVEISAPHNYQTVDELKVVLKEYKSKGINLSLHNYFPAPKNSFVLNMAASDSSTFDMTEELVKNAFLLAGYAGSPIYGIHAGYLAKAKAGSDGHFIFSEEEENYKTSLENTIKFVNHILKYKPKDLVFAIENLFPSPKKRHSLNCTYEEIEELMCSLPDHVGILLDLGHLNISSNILGFNRNKAIDKLLTNYFSRIKEIHISENNGIKDEHLAVKENSWQLDVLKSISSQDKNKDIIYCIEARKASENEILNSVYLVNSVLN